MAQSHPSTVAADRSTPAAGSSHGDPPASGSEGLVADLLRLVGGLPRRLAGRSLPPVVAVAATAETLSLLLGEPRDDPALGFDVIDDGFTWVIRRSAIGNGAAGPPVGSPWPMLVTLGSVVPQGSVVLANLEQLGAVSATGQPEDVRALLEEVAAELAGSPLADGIEIVCVDCAHTLQGAAGVRVVARLGDVLADLVQQVARLRAAATAPQGPPVPVGAAPGRPRPARPGESAHRRRAAQPRLNEPPAERRGVLVLDPHTRDPRLLQYVYRLAGPGLAVMTGTARNGSAPRNATRPTADAAPWRLEIDGDRLRWEPVGAELRRNGPPALALGVPAPATNGSDPAAPLNGSRPWSHRIPDTSATIPRKPAPTSVPAPVRAPMPTSVSTPARAPARAGGGPARSGAAGAARGWRAPPAPAALYPGVGECGGASGLGVLSLHATAPGVMAGPVELQVLGIVRPVGAARAFTSQRALDLVCYLAFHRDGATPDQLKHWLWQAERAPTSKSLANVVSHGRVSLGRDADGKPYLSRLAAAGIYRLSAQVTTDVERFNAWLQVAEAAQPARTLACLRAALALVRGTPFGGGSGHTFSWADNALRGHVEYLIDATAHRLADLAIEFGRIDIARWATQQGLVAAPGCDQCFERRLVVAQRSGSRREVDQVRRDMHRALIESDSYLDALPDFAGADLPDDLGSDLWQ